MFEVDSRYSTGKKVEKCSLVGLNIPGEYENLPKIDRSPQTGRNCRRSFDHFELRRVVTSIITNNECNN